MDDLEPEGIDRKGAAQPYSVEVTRVKGLIRLNVAIEMLDVT